MPGPGLSLAPCCSPPLWSEELEPMTPEVCCSSRILGLLHGAHSNPDSVQQSQDT